MVDNILKLLDDGELTHRITRTEARMARYAERRIPHGRLILELAALRNERRRRLRVTGDELASYMASEATGHLEENLRKESGSKPDTLGRGLLTLSEVN